MRHAWKHNNRWSVCERCGARYRNNYASRVYEFPDGRRSATAGRCGEVPAKVDTSLGYDEVLFQCYDNGMRSIQELETFEFINLMRLAGGRSQEEVQAALDNLWREYGDAD